MQIIELYKMCGIDELNGIIVQIETWTKSEIIREKTKLLNCP